MIDAYDELPKPDQVALDMLQEAAQAVLDVTTKYVVRVPHPPALELMNIQELEAITRMIDIWVDATSRIPEQVMKAFPELAKAIEKDEAIARLLNEIAKNPQR